MTREFQHRCLATGETIELEGRHLEDAQEYRTEHDDCMVTCVQYHSLTAYNRLEETAQQFPEL